MITQEARTAYPALTSALFPEPRRIEPSKPATRAQIQSFIRSARRHKDYAYRVPADSQLRGRRFTNYLPSWQGVSDFHLQHQILIERQSPLTTVNEDGEVSSRSLTDWYVQQYCKANHLKEC